MSAHRRPDWLFQADRAPSSLSLDQRAYAIQLRRQLAASLADKASRRAIGDLSPAGTEWTRIADACRREVRRMDTCGAQLAQLLDQGDAA